MDTDTYNAQARAEAGYQFLEAIDPGVVDRIDLETLDIGSSSRCVFGQCYGSYSAGLRRYGFSTGGTTTEHREQAAALGLTTEREGGGPQEMAALTAAWRAAIAAKRVGQRAPELVPA